MQIDPLRRLGPYSTQIMRRIGGRVRRLNRYIHGLPEWPRFHWNGERLAGPLSAVRHHQGRLAGRMGALGFPLQQEAVLQTLTTDVLKTSEIEGEKLDAEQVRSSIARRLGMDRSEERRVGKERR